MGKWRRPKHAGGLPASIAAFKQPRIHDGRRESARQSTFPPFSCRKMASATPRRPVANERYSHTIHWLKRAANCLCAEGGLAAIRFMRLCGEQVNPETGAEAMASSSGGTTPKSPHGTVRDTLAAYGSSCPTRNGGRITYRLDDVNLTSFFTPATASHTAENCT